MNNIQEIGNFLDLRKNRADFKTYPMRIEDFVEAKRFNIQPDFQREYVWNDQKASALIESILLSLPIPAVFTYINHATGEEAVIDGQQRLYTIKRFINNAFQLQALKRLGHLDGLYFYQLDNEFKMRILTYDINITCLNNISNKSIIYEIFERLNTGGMKLNSQEIRNCIYGGQYNDYIKNELAMIKDYREIMQKFKLKRFMPEELIVRFFAFCDNLDSYKGNMKAFINKYYEEHLYLNDFNKLDFKNYIKKPEKNFKECLNACNIVFGNTAFKRIHKYSTPIDGKNFCYGTFYKPVYDMQMLGFAGLDEMLLTYIEMQK